MTRSFFCCFALLLMVSAAHAADSISASTDEGTTTVVAPDAHPRPIHPRRKHVITQQSEAKHSEPIGILLSGGDMAIWQKASDGRTYDLLQRYSFRAGYSFRGLFDVYGEYGFYSANSDSGGNVSIHYHHEEYLIWLRKMFLEDRWWAPYAAAGLGAQQEVVTTTLASDSTRNTGSLQVLGALAGGMRFGTIVQVLIEGRLSFSAGLSPNPEPGIGIQLGTHF